MSENTLPTDIASTVLRALQEDIGSGDITAALIPPETAVCASLITREHAVICGIPWAQEVLKQVDKTLQSNWLVKDGDWLRPGECLAEFTGCARSILTAERCLLNFLQTLSSTATYARKLRDKVAHTNVVLLDTRKTLPGLRTAQKYAVRIGGCTNHRMGLYDGFLIKENHIQACGAIAEAISKARQLDSSKQVEIEVESLEQLQEAIQAKADIVMLDNFTIEQTESAVKLNRGQVKLEASGSIDDHSLVTIAETGVDYISIGALTKNCQAIDLSLRVE